MKHSPSASSGAILYGIPNCSTVKKARDWLEANGIAYAFHDYKKQGVPVAELQKRMTAQGWEPFVNRRGPTWRTLDAATQTRVTDAASALAVMQASPSVIKRPLITFNDRHLLGFSEDTYVAFFAQ